MSDINNILPATDSFMCEVKAQGRHRVAALLRQLADALDSTEGNGCLEIYITEDDELYVSYSALRNVLEART